MYEYVNILYKVIMFVCFRFQQDGSDFITQNLGPNIGVFTILKKGNSQTNEENY